MTIAPPAKPLFNLLMSGSSAETRIKKESNEIIRWIPIVTLLNNATGRKDRIGITEAGYWATDGNYGLSIIEDEKKYFWLVATMTHPMGEIAREIRRNPTVNRHADEIIANFPFVEIIRAGFKTFSPYWLEYAFGWFEKLPLAARASVSDELEAIRTARPRFSQQFRHRAQKELARIRRELK